MKVTPWAATLLSVTAIEAASVYKQGTAANDGFHPVNSFPTPASRFDGDKVVQACTSNLLDMKTTLDMIEVVCRH